MIHLNHWIDLKGMMLALRIFRADNHASCRAILRFITICATLCVLQLSFSVHASKTDLVINDFYSIREGTVDQNKSPIKNLLGYTSRVYNDKTARVESPSLLFLTNSNATFSTNLGPDDKCESYEGFSFLEITYRFADGYYTNFDVGLEVCNNVCDDEGLCEDVIELISYKVENTPQQGEYDPKEWAKTTINLNDISDPYKKRISSILIYEFEYDVWLEIGKIKLTGDGSDLNEVNQSNVGIKYLEDNEEYIVDDFIDNHRYISQTNYHGHITSDDWSCKKPTVGALGALWMTTNKDSYWYSALASNTGSLDLSKYEYLSFYVRFPFESPSPFQVTITSGLDQAKVNSAVLVALKSPDVQLNDTEDWQHVLIPLSKFKGGDLKQAKTLSLVGFKENLVVQFGTIKFTNKTEEVPFEVEILPSIDLLPPLNLKYTPDGTCGVTSKGIDTEYICGKKSNAPAGAPSFGSCCSSEGKCGDTAKECGPGCQDGYGLCDKSGKKTPMGGEWILFGDSGVSVQHAWLVPYTNRIIFSDRQQDYETLNYNGKPTFFTVRLDLDTKSLVSISQTTNAFCSGGSWLTDGTLVMFGGHEPIESNPGNLIDGIDGIRVFKDNWNGTTNFQEWNDVKLTKGRWYPTATTLSDNRIFVISGLSAQGRDRDKVNPTWEIYDPRNPGKQKAVALPWIMRSDPYELYPYVYVLPNGRLLIRAGIHSIIFDHIKNTYEMLPDVLIPGQNYPKTGSSVMLPLTKKNDWKMTLMFCGGSSTIEDAYFDTNSPATNMCATISPLDRKPHWKLSKMPNRRLMSDGLMLPDGKILWINGATTGSQGYWSADNPILTPDMYDPETDTWTTLAPSKIERLYHSIAHLLPDGRVLVSGSTPNDPPLPVAGKFQNRYEVEIFTPPYLVGVKDGDRPVIVSCPPYVYSNGDTFVIEVKNLNAELKKDIKVMLIATGFVTHSIHMNERSLDLEFEIDGDKLIVESPPNIYIGVPGPYLVFVVSNGIPSIARWTILQS